MVDEELIRLLYEWELGNNVTSGAYTKIIMLPFFLCHYDTWMSVLCSSGICLTIQKVASSPGYLHATFISWEWPKLYVYQVSALHGLLTAAFQ